MVKGLLLLCVVLATGGVARATEGSDGTCRPDGLTDLVRKHAPNVRLSKARLMSQTLVLEAGETGAQWKALLTLSHAEGTIYTSVGGEKLTPARRLRLAGILEDAAADPAIREALRTCADTSATAAEQSSVLQEALDRDKDVPAKTLEEESPATTYIWILLPLLWALFFSCGLACLWRRRGFDRREALIVFGVVLLGLALRLMLPPWGPGDISNTVASAQLGAEHIRDFGHYGRGPEGLLLLVAPVLGAGEDTLVLINLMAGCASVALLYGFVRQLGYGVLVARLAALLLAVAPLHVRFSPTYNRYILLIFLMLAGWMLLLAFIRQGRGVDLFGAILALSLAPQCRPEAAVLPVATLGLVACACANEGLRRAISSRRRWLVAALLLHAAIIYFPVQSVLETATSSERWAAEYVDASRPIFDPSYNAFLSPWITPIPWAVLALVGLLRPPFGNRWLLAWCVGIALGFTTIVATRDLGDSHVIDARYHLTALPFYLLLTAAGTATLIEWVQKHASPGRQRAVALLLSLGLAGCAALSVSTATMRTTMNQEYDFAREALPRVPAGCTIIAYEPDYDLGLRAPFHLSTQLGLDHEWILVRDAKFEERSQACLIYYHTASCQTVTDVKADAEAQTTLCKGLLNRATEAIATAQLDALPAGDYRYRTDPVEVGLYWLKKPR